VILRLSNLFVRTLRDDPADAELPGHTAMVRAGYIRRAGSGMHTWLPLGHLVYRKVEAIVREEMDRMGAQEVHFPALLPREPYELSGRWEEYGATLFRLRTAAATTTSSRRPTRRCSRCWSRTCTPPTRTCR